MWKVIDRTLRSPGLTITLISLIALASIAGTVPLSALESGTAGEILAPVFRFLGAEQIYRTRWYMSLLGVLMCVMTYCSVRRVPSVIRAFRNSSDALERGNLVMTESFVAHRDLDGNTHKEIINLLRIRGYRVRASGDSTNKAFVFEKGRAGVLGPLVVHMGLLIVFIGGFVTHSFGSVTEMDIGEGDAYSLGESGMRVKLEKFSIIAHPSAREPEEYVSTLMVARDDQPRSWHMLRVNNPLRLSGFNLYQMRYRPEIRHVSLGVFTRATQEPLGLMKLVPGGRAEVPGHDVEVELGTIVPDFAIDSDGNIYSRSQYYVNPAASVSLYRPGAREPFWSGWAFKGTFPPHESSSAPFVLTLERLSLKYFSGIKVVHDPGTPIVYLGFGLLVVGSLISCYMFRRFVRVDCEETSNGQTLLTLTGRSLKNQPDFAYEWNGLVRQIRTAIEE
ncbi:MAG: cytochrome c biogenesis protein [Candidatus Abyssubacteria bacterium]